MQSAIEKEFHDFLYKIKGRIVFHDRFVIITFLMAFVPSPFTALISFFLTLLQLRFVSTNKLPKSEKSMLLIAMCASVINCAFWIFIIYYMDTKNMAGDLLHYLRSIQIFPFQFFKKLITVAVEV